MKIMYKIQGFHQNTETVSDVVNTDNGITIIYNCDSDESPEWKFIPYNHLLYLMVFSEKTE